MFFSFLQIFVAGSNRFENKRDRISSFEEKRAEERKGESFAGWLQGKAPLLGDAREVDVVEVEFFFFFAKKRKKNTKQKQEAIFFISAPLFFHLPSRF